MTGFRQGDNKLIYQLNQEVIQIDPWGLDSLRVGTTHNPSICEDLPVILQPPTETGTVIGITERSGAIRNGALRAEIHLEGDIDGQRAEIHFINTQTNQEILAEPSSHFPRHPARYYRSLGGEYYKIEQRFQAYEGEKLYGLGQHQHSWLDQKGGPFEIHHLSNQPGLETGYL